MDMFFSLCCQWSEAREVPLCPSMRRSTGELDLAPPLFPSSRRVAWSSQGKWWRPKLGMEERMQRRRISGLSCVRGGSPPSPHRSWLTKGRRISWFNLDIICAYFQQQLLIINDNGHIRFEANLSCHQPQECTVQLGFCFVSGMPTGEARVHGSLLMGNNTWTKCHKGD